MLHASVFFAMTSGLAMKAQQKCASYLSDREKHFEVSVATQQVKYAILNMNNFTGFPKLLFI